LPQFIGQLTQLGELQTAQVRGRFDGFQQWISSGFGGHSAEFIPLKRARANGK
jgi:hypothetical protein